MNSSCGPLPPVQWPFSQHCNGHGTIECLNSTWACDCEPGWSTIAYAVWPQTEEYCSIPDAAGKFSFWFLCIPYIIVYILGSLLTISQCRKGLYAKVADTNTRALLSVGPLTILMSGCIIGFVIAQLYMPTSGYAEVLVGCAVGIMWVLIIAYTMIYFQFLEKQVKMNEELRNRFHVKYGKVLRYYMPFHILFTLAVINVIFVPYNSSPFVWQVSRGVCMTAFVIPQCIIGLYILPSAMKFSIREIEAGLTERHKSMRPKAAADDTNESASYRNSKKIRSLLFRMKTGYVVLLGTIAVQLVFLILTNAVPGLTFLGGIHIAIGLGSVGIIIIAQYFILLHELDTSYCKCLGSSRTPSTALSPTKSMPNISHERSAPTSGIRPTSISPQENPTVDQ